jgi:hypothetical protein
MLSNFLSRGLSAMPRECLLAVCASPMMAELYNTALELFTAGVGAIIGLVGGSKLT